MTSTVKRHLKSNVKRHLTSTVKYTLATNYDIETILDMSTSVSNTGPTAQPEDLYC